MELKAYLTAGWVGSIHAAYVALTNGSKVIANSLFMTRAHSQYHKPWFAAEQSGTIICAHCTCMAELGEACLHISALLQKLTLVLIRWTYYYYG